MVLRFSRMTLKDDLTSDLDIFLNNEEFAIEVTYNLTTFNGIYDNAFIDDQQGGIQAETLDPQIMVKTSDVSGLTHGETMTVNSVAYKVREIQPDGTGLTRILLTRD